MRISYRKLPLEKKILMVTSLIEMTQTKKVKERKLRWIPAPIYELIIHVVFYIFHLFEAGITTMGLA